MMRSKKKGGHELSSDKEVLDEAAEIQRDTKASIERIQQSAAATREIGVTTLEQLEEQRRQLERIQNEGDRTQENLKTTERLQNKLSRWSLSFNGGAARRKAKEARDHEEKQDKIKQERKERLAIEESAMQAQNEPEVVVEAHGKKKKELRKNRKKVGGEKKKSVVNASTQKSLLYGSSGNKTGNGELDSDLQRLDEEDREINQDLDAVGDQLDELFDMAQAMGNEAESHGRGLDDFTDQMADINHKQRVANNRTGRFLTGKVRKEYEKEGVNSATGFW